VEPAISVIIPTYNRAEYLGESLDSILSQDAPSFEVIVVDDGSTDETAAALVPYGSRVRVIRQRNLGIAAARNAGLAAASGQFVAFHDSDDIALPGRLMIPYAYLIDHPDMDIVIGNGIFLPPPGSTVASRPWLRPEVAAVLDGCEITVREVFRWNLGQLQATLISRESLLGVGPLDSEFLILDDLDIVLRLSLRYRAVFLDRPFFAYRRHGAGITQNRMLLRQESIRLAEKLLGAHPEVLEQLGQTDYQRRQARRYARLATLKMEAGDAAGARDALAQACKLDPRKVRYRLRALALALRKR
jgi:glycosyltransferase involved in cell wall biosynthesis